MPTPPPLRCTPPENAAELDPAALAERFPFLPSADLWDLPDWKARAVFGFRPAPVVVALAERPGLRAVHPPDAPRPEAANL